MKNVAVIVLYCLLLSSVSISCWHRSNNDNINLTVSESGNDYKITAEYPEQNTVNVERYMNRKFGDESNISFINTRIDAEITLDDGTKFYMNNRPGILELKLDKSENSNASYRKIKAFGEGLKPVLQQQ